MAIVFPKKAASAPDWLPFLKILLIHHKGLGRPGWFCLVIEVMETSSLGLGVLGVTVACSDWLIYLKEASHWFIEVLQDAVAVSHWQRENML